jgi:phage terminase Nu1 subunit (DNA packaging protein)
MNKLSNLANSAGSQAVADKRGLAARYMVGVRTIEKWQAAGIIDGERKGLRNYYDVAQCDGRLWKFRNQRNVMEKIEQPKTDRLFADKKNLAQRYDVSPRTISNWMNAGLLAYIKIRNIVRFDIPACDAALRQQEFNSPENPFTHN